MAAEGAVRRNSGPDWVTAGFLVLSVDSRADLASIVDHEPGQTAFLEDEKTLVLWDGTAWTNLVNQIGAFDSTVPYAAGAVVYNTVDHTLYRANADVAAATATPDTDNVNWEPLYLFHEPAEDFDAQRDYLAGDLAWDNGALYRAPSDIAASATLPSAGPPWQFVADGRPAAPDFDPAHVYRAGELAYDTTTRQVFRAGQAIAASATIPSAAPAATGWELLQSPAAPAFNQAVDYHEGDLVWHNGVLYRASAAIPASPQTPDLAATWENVQQDHRLYGLSTDAIPATSHAGDWYQATDTHEIGRLEASGAGGALQRVPTLSETLIRQWIAEGGLFQGGVMTAGGAVTGSTGIDALPTPAAGNRGHYWIATEQIVNPPAPAALAGETINPGDWLVSTGDPTTGLGGWTIVHGGGLTRAIADTLYAPLDSVQHYTSSRVAGETPQAPGTATMPAHPNIGDMFVNTTDRTSWVAVMNPANPGQIIWQTAGNDPEHVIVSTVAGETPMAPGTAVLPAPTPVAGDTFVNTTDKRAWIYNGTTWTEYAASGGAKVIVNRVAGQTPTTNPPANPKMGDIFQNLTDHKLFIYDGTAWNEQIFGAAYQVWAQDDPPTVSTPPPMIPLWIDTNEDPPTSSSAPVGIIVAFPSLTPPKGWLLCDGSNFNAVTYKELYALLGNSDTLPDLRDQFIRGATPANPPGRREAQSTAMPNNPFAAGSGGGHTHTTAPAGNHYHDYQISAGGTSVYNDAAHAGNIGIEYGNNNWSSDHLDRRAGSGLMWANGEHSHTVSPASGHTHPVTGGDAETRPRNVRMAYIIKALP